jgi:hypothetical protein
VGHYVVPQPPLVPGGRLEVNISDAGLELVDLLLGDWVMGSPSSFSASARATHSLRHVLNFRCGLHRALISGEA